MLQRQRTFLLELEKTVRVPKDSFQGSLLVPTRIRVRGVFYFDQRRESAGRSRNARIAGDLYL
jgi:hypothetical protein